MAASAISILIVALFLVVVAATVAAPAVVAVGRNVQA